MKPKIKSIIFDLGGVVMHGGYLNFIHHYCLKCLTRQGKKTITALEHQVNVGKITERQFYDNIRKIFGVEMTPRQMQKIIEDKMQPDKKLLKLIPLLQPAKVALFTNSIGYMAVHVLHARRVPTKKLFNKMFFSNTMHLAKPDAGGYHYVIKHLKVKPDQALMVDDRPENIRAAKKAGLQGLLYKNAAQFQRDIKKYELA